MCKRAISGGGGMKHFACFACRKGLKQQGSNLRDAVDRPFPCPDCKAPMSDMGTDFAVPRRRDMRQWLKVEALFAFGVRYAAGCCDGPGFRPKRLRDVVGFLAKTTEDRPEVRRRTEEVVQARRAQWAKAGPLRTASVPG